jgi:catechol-2,3-dioxygenase
MHLQGIEKVTLTALDLETARQFYLDWGLSLKKEDTNALLFESLNGAQVIVHASTDAQLPKGIEKDPTLREVTWCVHDAAALDHFRTQLSSLSSFEDHTEVIKCKDPSGLSLAIVLSQKKELHLSSALTNSWDQRQRINQPSPIYDKATPIEVGHIVLFVANLAESSAFYQNLLGFTLSDTYPNRGHFLRCTPNGGHHDLFLLQLPNQRVGLNHIAFTVRDLHEVFGGGMHMSRCGWKTELGPGKHPVSSAIFWYFHAPTGALVEYYSDEDELTPEWIAREITPGPTMFAEWAITGGIDGHTRRQLDAQAPSGQFMTDTPKK